MKAIKIFFTGLVALALHSSVWAQDKVYETTDAEGNPVFTDSPPQEDATVIDIQQTNVVDAPQEQPQQELQQQQQSQQQIAPQQAPAQGENPVVVDDDGGYDADGYNELEESELRRQRALEAADPEAPHEVGDSLDQEPHEVGDSLNQTPDEVGDFNAPPEEGIYGGGDPEQIERDAEHPDAAAARRR